MNRKEGADMPAQYSIRDVSAMMHIPATTLRYYDKEGLLPNIERKESGYRIFSEDDVAMLKVIDCLKKTGMSIKEIRRFIEWVKMGDASLEERYQMFLERRRAVEEQMAELQRMMKFIDHKCQYYETAIAAGTENIHLGTCEDGIECGEQEK